MVCAIVCPVGRNWEGGLALAIGSFPTGVAWIIVARTFGRGFLEGSESCWKKPNWLLVKSMG
jgi:hypothetical protein